MLSQQSAMATTSQCTHVLLGLEKLSRRLIQEYSQRRKDHAETVCYRLPLSTKLEAYLLIGMDHKTSCFVLFCGTGDSTQGFAYAKQTLYYWWEAVRLITLNVETHSLDNSTYPFHLTFKGIGDDSVHKVLAAEAWGPEFGCPHKQPDVWLTPVTPETGSQTQTDLRGLLYSQVIQSTVLQVEW